MNRSNNRIIPWWMNCIRRSNTMFRMSRMWPKWHNNNYPIPHEGIIVPGPWSFLWPWHLSSRSCWYSRYPNPPSGRSIPNISNHHHLLLLPPPQQMKHTFVVYCPVVSKNVITFPIRWLKKTIRTRHHSRKFKSSQNYHHHHNNSNSKKKKWMITLQVQMIWVPLWRHTITIDCIQNCDRRPSLKWIYHVSINYYKHTHPYCTIPIPMDGVYCMNWHVVVAVVRMSKIVWNWSNIWSNKIVPWYNWPPILDWHHMT